MSFSVWTSKPEHNKELRICISYLKDFISWSSKHPSKCNSVFNFIIQKQRTQEWRTMFSSRHIEITQHYTTLQTFLVHRTAGEVGWYFFNSSLNPWNLNFLLPWQDNANTKKDFSHFCQQNGNLVRQNGKMIFLYYYFLLLYKYSK